MNKLDYLKVTEEEIENGIKDEFCVVYSAAGKRLLKCENLYELTTYTIKEGTVYICNEAFEHCKNLAEINIPDSVTHIGRNAFNFVFRSPKQPKLFRNNQV